MNAKLEALLSLKQSVDSLEVLPAKLDELLALGPIVQCLQTTVKDVETSISDFSAKYNSLLTLATSNNQTVKALEAEVSDLQAKLSMGLVVMYNVSVRVFSFPVDHWCKPPLEFSKMSPGQWKNFAIPETNDGRYDQCYQYDLNILNPNVSRPLVPCEAWDYDLLPERHTIISFWNLVCNRSRLLFIASAFENVGGLLLVPVVGQTTDRVGRRPATFFCVIVALISGFLASVAKKFPIFVVARVFVAASVNALKLVIFILLLEVTSSDRRELYGCLVHIGSVAAFIFVVSIHGFFMDRQVVSLITMMPMSFLVFAFYAVQESPRWLLALQDVESARAVLLVVSHLNNVNTRKFQNPPWNA
ncbi:hypothetical protein HPB47_014943, partial [Ixodes persulcatus]